MSPTASDGTGAVIAMDAAIVAGAVITAHIVIEVGAVTAAGA